MSVFTLIRFTVYSLPVTKSRLLLHFRAFSQLAVIHRVITKNMARKTKKRKRTKTRTKREKKRKIRKKRKRKTGKIKRRKRK